MGKYHSRSPQLGLESLILLMYSTFSVLFFFPFFSKTASLRFNEETDFIDDVPPSLEFRAASKNLSNCQLRHRSAGLQQLAQFFLISTYFILSILGSTTQTSGSPTFGSKHKCNGVGSNSLNQTSSSAEYWPHFFFATIAALLLMEKRHR